MDTRKYLETGGMWKHKCSKERELHDILLRPHTTSVSWHGPNCLTTFAFSHSGEHKDRICLWQESTPTFLSYVLTSVLSAPLSRSLPVRSDTKTLAYIAAHCKQMQTLTFFSWTRGGETYSVPLELSWAFQALLNMLLVKLTVMHVDYVGSSSFWDSFQLQYLDADTDFTEFFSVWNLAL